MDFPAYRHHLVRLGLASVLTLAGCQTALDQRDTDSLPPSSGVQPIKGLAENASIRRSELGVPLIETSTFHDALFTLGYVHASDRLNQMVTLRLLAQGRLSEMAGPEALDADRLMRAVNLRKTAEAAYKNASPRMKKFLDVYARGVNAYLFRYRDKLPADLAATGYQPEYWKPEDCALLFVLLDFSLSANLKEELASLELAQKVSADTLAWLLPSYPDEPIPFDEANKLKGLSLAGQIPGLQGLSNASAHIAQVNGLAVPAGSSWAIAPQRSRSGKSLLAGDLTQSLALPSAWSYIQIRAPRYQAAGLSLAGTPFIFAGYNGTLAWSFSPAMGDTQDLYLERVRNQGNGLSYEVNGKWTPAAVRSETFFIKGQRPVREMQFETRHGPLLNNLTGQQSGYGLALRRATLEADKSMDAVFDLSRAKNVDRAFEVTRDIRALPLNIVFTDAEHIAWQVTGLYPNRREGRGLLPSPGWTDRYEWDGFADPMLHPYDQDPSQGWLGNAGNRTVPLGYGMQLSSSWQAPERAERMAQLAVSQTRQDARNLIAMQADQTSPLVAKVQTMLSAPGMDQPLKSAIGALPGEQRAHASEALRRISAFDGRLLATSADAAIYEAFLQATARLTFADELGGSDSSAMQALNRIATLSYSAQIDHLLTRDDSPFWNDTRTAAKHDKPAILAQALASAITECEQTMGADRASWQWGRLHTYDWRRETDKAASRLGIKADYPIRKALPAGGDFSTLDRSAYSWEQGFGAQSASTLRLVVDFGQPEPFMAIDGKGQSDNPASPYYAKGIEPWLKGQYSSFPFQPQNLERVYGTRRLTLTPAK
ncbi:acyl-homoserine lactone acylase QuiP [Pseudomonas asuensis]|uniref:Acyl-homoserine lactone acylase QuiP n=1 Tax=Pseudomonas asuensis TaxID=1825787 RepID=A0ABQ2GQQ4_9PSED|nr:penicillin acylase family protein [Pseudomonas asuensis]GGM07253.1 acyl-homoserine lactone acylase QuiP [Pseudomonas asuensis]